MTPDSAENTSEVRLQERILKFEADAERAMDIALQLQVDFAQRLMLASGAALGVLSTLIATDTSWLSPKEFVGPVILAIILSGIGVWTRTLALFAKVHILIKQAAAYSWMKAVVEDQVQRGVLGAEPLPQKPNFPPFPEWLFNLLDYVVIAAGASFAAGLIWASLTIVLTV